MIAVLVMIRYSPHRKMCLVLQSAPRLKLNALPGKNIKVCLFLDTNHYQQRYLIYSLFTMRHFLVMHWIALYFTWTMSNFT